MGLRSYLQERRLRKADSASQCNLKSSQSLLSLREGSDNFSALPEGRSDPQNEFEREPLFGDIPPPLSASVPETTQKTWFTFWRRQAPPTKTPLDELSIEETKSLFRTHNSTSRSKTPGSVNIHTTFMRERKIAKRQCESHYRDVLASHKFPLITKMEFCEDGIMRGDWVSSKKSKVSFTPTVEKSMAFTEISPNLVGEKLKRTEDHNIEGPYTNFADTADILKVHPLEKLPEFDSNSDEAPPGTLMFMPASLLS